jgi:hypothetical protein
MATLFRHFVFFLIDGTKIKTIASERKRDRKILLI